MKNTASIVVALTLFGALTDLWSRREACQMKRISIWGLAVRFLALFVLTTVVATCDGGPSGSDDGSVPQIAGQWQGTIEFIEDTCNGETGVEDSGIIVVEQVGSAITVIFEVGEGTVRLTGTIEPDGSFQATGSTVFDGIQTELTLQGQVNGDSVQGTYSGHAGSVCSFLVSFTLNRL